MNNVMKYRIHQLYIFLKEAMPIMILGMLIFFGAAIIGFQQDNRDILKGIEATTKNTEIIVDKQDETLDAIKALSLDNKLTSKQLGDTIICMLLVPVGQRTAETQENCRAQAISDNPASDESGSTTTQPVPVQSTEQNQNSQSPPESQPPEPTPSILENLLDIVTDPFGFLGRR